MVKKYFALGLITLLAASAPRLHAQAVTANPPVERAVAVEAAAPRAQPVYPMQAAAPKQGSQTIPAVPNPGAVPLRNGDTVDIRIANVPLEDEQQWNAPYTLDESGGLNLPFIGMIKAGGLPPSQVQIVIQNKLISDGIYTNPTITVNPPAGMRFVSVGGGVRAPGRLPYTSDLTLMSTINAAGGTSDFAGDKIRLVRGGKVLFFSKKKLYKDPTMDPRIEPGDQIEVVESIW
jgi:polysaccharide export outer membrane protein